MGESAPYEPQPTDDLLRFVIDHPRMGIQDIESLHSKLGMKRTEFAALIGEAVIDQELVPGNDGFHVVVETSERQQAIPGSGKWNRIEPGSPADVALKALHKAQKEAQFACETSGYSASGRYSRSRRWR